MLRNHRWIWVLLFLTPLSTIAAASAVGAEGDRDTSLRSYHTANGLLNRGLHELAIAEYRKFLSEHESHAKAATARYGLGICLYRLGRFSEAAVELAPLKQLAPMPYEAEVAAVLGQCFLGQQQYAEAASQFDDVVEKHLRHDLADDAAAGAAEAYYRNGQFDEAIGRCRLLGRRWPESPLRERTEFFWGLSAMEQGDYKTAGKRLGNILEDFGTGPFADQAAILVAQCYHHRDLPDRARAMYRNVLDRSKTDYASDALFGLGMLGLQKEQWKESGEFFERLIAEHPDSPLVTSGRFYCGQTWFERGELDRALTLFQQREHALTGTALEDDTAYWVAKCKLRQGRFADAAKDMDQAIEAFPKSELIGEMYYDRSICLLRGADADGGIKALGQFLRRFPEHDLAADGLHLLAATEHEQNHFGKSGEHCRKFLERYKSHDLEPAIAFLAAENLFLLGEYSDAIEGFRGFLERFRDDEQAARARYRLGSSLYMIERFDEAKPLLEEAVAMAKADDRSAPASVGGVFRFSFLALGDIHFQAGEWKRAEDLLGHYLASGSNVPSVDDALLKLGLALQRQDKHEEALLAFDRLLERFGQSAHRLQALFERGQALVALGRGNQAKEAFELVLSEGGDSRFSSHALNHLGSLAMQRKDFEAAAGLFEDAGAPNQDSTRTGEQPATAGGLPANAAGLLFQRGRADGRWAAWRG